MRTYEPSAHLLTDPWAPHPVVNRHVCNGDGGDGGVGDMELPDYHDQIAAAGEFIGDSKRRANETYDEAKARGEEGMETARDVSGRSKAASLTEQERSDRLMGDWERRTKPLYEAQSEEAQRMNKDAGAYEAHQAGRYGADAGNAIDQQMASLKRKMIGSGETGASGIAGQALDTMAGMGRAAVTAAAAQKGIDAAKDERRKVTSNALTQDQYTAGVGESEGAAAGANRAQQTGVMNAAAGTGASLYNPSIGFAGQQLGGINAWGTSLNAQTSAALEKEKLAQASSGGGIGATLLPMAMGIGGSFLGPMGGAVGKAGGDVLGKSLFGAAATGGKIVGRRVPRGYARGGAIDTSSPHMITPDMSPSGGEQVDDVPAMVSEGEFVIPERTVDWYGEQYFQKLIMKADMEREKQTVAAPEEMPADEQTQQAMDTSPPAFRSEGARV